ncbi:hypothetical protein [Vulcaniibacterium gelatinicum]|uniref:hypothetical protein n=1 Tax=Vulcaniibacterium gelatinicum TaxID=2598725 RepID=UPI0011CC48C1|nr:hypothetical protein [Vulcaniibacterium gelatinicum]
MVQRERFAWVWMAALVVLLGTYFIGVGFYAREWQALSEGQRIGLLAIPLALMAVVVGIDRLVARVRRGRAPAEPVDERDHAIEGRASSAGYHTLMFGTIFVGCYLPFSADRWQIVHATLLAIAIAEVVRHGLIARGYRQGAT